MKLKLVIATLALAAMVLIQGCQSSGSIVNSLSSPAQKTPPWAEVKTTVIPQHPTLVQEGGDIVFTGMGEAMGFFALPEEDRQILALGWENEIVGFYILDLHARCINALGGIQFRGVKPKLETFVWPWLLLSNEDEEGNRSWVLVDLAQDQPQIAWRSEAWVPQGLRRRPVWYSGQTWYLGPVAGPVVTDVLSGETVQNKPKYEMVNPVIEDWPHWGGGVSNSDWYLYPHQGGGCSLVDLESGREWSLAQDKELVWNAQRTLLAWRQDGHLGLLVPGGKSTVLTTTGTIPGVPLWSANSDTLYFLGGEDNYFGTTWKTLWSWEEEIDAKRLFDLPGSWNRWRLLLATSDAVLAMAGDVGEHLVYFDVANEIIHDLNSVTQYLWREGTLVALREGELLRLSPGFPTKILAREAQDYTLLGMVNQYVIYSREGKIYIKQLAQ